MPGGHGQHTPRRWWRARRHWCSEHGTHTPSGGTGSRACGFQCARSRGTGSAASSGRNSVFSSVSAVSAAAAVLCWGAGQGGGRGHRRPAAAGASAVGTALHIPVRELCCRHLRAACPWRRRRRREAVPWSRDALVRVRRDPSNIDRAAGARPCVEKVTLGPASGAWRGRGLSQGSARQERLRPCRPHGQPRREVTRCPSLFPCGRVRCPVHPLSPCPRSPRVVPTRVLTHLHPPPRGTSRTKPHTFSHTSHQYFVSIRFIF